MLVFSLCVLFLKIAFYELNKVGKFVIYPICIVMTAIAIPFMLFELVIVDSIVCLLLLFSREYDIWDFLNYAFFHF